MIKKMKPEKWCLYTHDGKEVIACHKTKKEAESQEAAINISKARAAGHRIPRKTSQKSSVK